MASDLHSSTEELSFQDVQDVERQKRKKLSQTVRILYMETCPVSRADFSYHNLKISVQKCSTYTYSFSEGLCLLNAKIKTAYLVSAVVIESSQFSNYVIMKRKFGSVLVLKITNTQ